VKIRNKFSGIVSSERADIAKAMIRQGMAEALEPEQQDTEPGKLPKYDPSRIPQPTWSVSIEGNVRKELCIRMELPGLVALYSGHPKNINSTVSWPGGQRWLSGFGRECPAEIATQYSRQWKDNEQLRAVVPFNPDVQQAFSSKVNDDQAADLAARPR
jgi:hypothetical protein